MNGSSGSGRRGGGRDFPAIAAPVIVSSQDTADTRLPLQERDRGGRPREEVVDLVGRLEADDEGVDRAEAEDEPERGVLARGVVILPSPRIFMPITPLPAPCISSSSEATSSGFLSSMISPSGLIRARLTSTNGALADVRSGSIPW